MMSIVKQLQSVVQRYEHFTDIRKKGILEKVFTERI